ncbi:MAG TPA: hypothetical protein VNZ86_13020 [Bacteroidia bacterium]|jgi:hypothetical protein|nr:hypothetical protein [Bacteroidia bacterium]
MSNSEYNNPFLISKIITILQDRHPDVSIGKYKRHSLSPDGRGFKVELDNGTILVTYDALAQVYDADEIPGYTTAMMESFVPATDAQKVADRAGFRIARFLQFFARKNVKDDNSAVRPR